MVSPRAATVAIALCVLQNHCAVPLAVCVVAVRRPHQALGRRTTSLDCSGSLSFAAWMWSEAASMQNLISVRSRCPMPHGVGRAAVLDRRINVHIDAEVLKRNCHPWRRVDGDEVPCEYSSHRFRRKVSQQMGGPLRHELRRRHRHHALRPCL